MKFILGFVSGLLVSFISLLIDLLRRKDIVTKGNDHERDESVPERPRMAQIISRRDPIREITSQEHE